MAPIGFIIIKIPLYIFSSQLILVLHSRSSRSFWFHNVLSQHVSIIFIGRHIEQYSLCSIQVLYTLQTQIEIQVINETRKESMISRERKLENNLFLMSLPLCRLVIIMSRTYYSHDNNSHICPKTKILTKILTRNLGRFSTQLYQDFPKTLIVLRYF